MRINEDYLDNVSASDIIAQDVNLQSPYIKQDGRPLESLIPDEYKKCIVSICIGNQNDAIPVNKLEQFKSILARIPGLNVSEFVVGPAMTESQYRFDDEDSGFNTYAKYLLGHTTDSPKKKLANSLFFGITLSNVDYTKAFDVVYMIPNITFKLFQQENTVFLYKGFSYNLVHFGRVATIVGCMKQAIVDVCAAVQPNSDPIDRIMDLFCAICGQSYSEANKLKATGRTSSGIDFIPLMQNHMKKRRYFGVI
jgi:hypothetical protein